MTRRLIRHHVNVANDFQGFSMIALQDRNLNKEIKVSRSDKIPMINLDMDIILL